jgi:putative ABC transport system permease protein
MFRPRWNKVISDLWSNKVRSLLVIASISIGLFAIGMISSLFYYLSQDMRASYAQVNPANILIRVAGYDEDYLEHVRSVPGIKEVEGAAVGELRLRVGEEAYIPIEVRAIPDFEGMNINKVTQIAGSWPPADKEIVIDKNKLADTGAQIGDEIEVRLPSGTIRKMRLVGVIQDQTIGADSGGGGYFMAPVQGYVTYDTLEWLEKPLLLNQVYATVTENPEDLNHIRAVADRLVEDFDADGYEVLNSTVRGSADHPIVSYLNAIGGVLIVLGLLSVFLSAFLITNTLSALLNQQIEQVGVMKTVGATRTQVNGIYFVLILAFSLIALAVSVPLANQAAYWEHRFLADQINFIAQGYRIIPQAIFLQVVIALLIPQLAGIFPILHGTRISIQEALSGTSSQGDLQNRAFNWLVRVRGFSRPLLISIRNTFRRRLRLALTLLTLVLGGAIFISTFNVRASLDDYMIQLRKYFLADVNLTFAQPYRIHEVDQVAKQVPGVDSVEAWSAARAEMIKSDGTPGENVQLLGPPADSTLIEPIMLAGRWIEPGDENAIVLSEMFMENFPDLHVGDTLPLKVDGDETDWVVIGFFKFAGKNAGLIAYTGDDYLSRLTGTSGKALTYRVVSGDGWHTLDAQKELGRRLEAHFNRLGFQVADVRAGKDLEGSTTQGLNILTTFLMIMATLMAVVGSIGLMGTMSLNVMERTREIGVMRAIGASDRIITKMVIVEGLIIGLISWLAGCLLSVPIGKVMSDVISSAIFSAPIAYTFILTGVIIWLVLVLLLSALASILPARSATRLTIREVLAYE